jgi:hypothetical protein
MNPLSWSSDQWQAVGICAVGAVVFVAAWVLATAAESVRESWSNR